MRIELNWNTKRLKRIERKVDEILTTNKEFLEVLGDLNEVTTEIGMDIDALMARPDMPDEVVMQLRPIVEKLRGVAAEYPVKEDPGPQPPVTDQDPVETPSDGGPASGEEGLGDEVPTLDPVDRKEFKGSKF